MEHTLPYLHKNMSEKTQKNRLHDLWDAWEKAQVGILSPATLRRYRSVFIRFAAWFDAVERHPPTLDDWHPITLVGYRSWLPETFSPNMVNTHISALRTWGEWLVEQGYKDANPALRLRLVRLQEKVAPSALNLITYAIRLLHVISNAILVIWLGWLGFWVTVPFGRHRYMCSQQRRRLSKGSVRLTSMPMQIESLDQTAPADIQGS